MKKKYPLTLQEYESIYSKVPRLNVEVVVKEKDGIVLTLRKIEPWKGQWHIPGGLVWNKETLEDAVRRVAKDEVGIDVRVKRFLGVIYYPSEEKLRGWGWAVGMAFLVKRVSGEFRGSEQGDEVRTFSKAEDGVIKEQKEFLIEHGLLKR